MLKRNGQLCQRTVPDYQGRLTDAEFLAYNTGFTAVEEDFRNLLTIHESLNELERSMPHLLEVSEAPVSDFNEIVPDQDRVRWSVVAPLLKLRRTQMLLCKRIENTKTEFAVIERLDSNSELAQAIGLWQRQMTSNDPRALLQDFIEGERQTLQLYGQDIVATAKEAIEEKFPERDSSRVIGAISQRCTKTISNAEQVVPIRSPRRSEGVHV